MFPKLILLGIFVGVCAALPTLYEANSEAIERWYAGASSGEPVAAAPVAEAPKQVAVVAPAAPAASSEPMLGRKVLVRSDPRGHFVAQFKLNGRNMEAMVDTGATVIALNRSTARRIGIALEAADFKYEVRTANGAVKAAAAVLDRVQIGRISLDNVEAMVLEDKALDGVLVGMSFLKRLQKFQIQDGALVMQQ